MIQSINEASVRSFARQAWPDPDTDLLIKSILLPPAQARLHWHRWLSRNDIDDCSWPQFKLLVRLSGRLRDIDPDCSEIPRLNGMAKALWTRSQLQLNAAARSLDQLIAADIDVYLMKTAAFEAVLPALLTRRVTSDLDFMVPRRQLLKAMQVLYSHGWQGPTTVEQALDRCRRNPGVNLTLTSMAGQPDADADIHHQPVHLPYLPDAHLDQLWDSAVSVRFRGRAVLAPRLEQLTLFSAMQGTRRFIPSHLSSGMWPLDLAELFRTGQLSHPYLLQLADEYQGHWALLSCLSYLEDELELKIPEGLVERLVAKCSRWSGAAYLYAQAPSYGGLKYLNIPLRELVLLGCQRAFWSRARGNRTFAP